MNDFAATRKPLPPASSASFADRLRAFALVALELALILLVVYLFEIETRKHFFALLCLAAGGFAVHAWLPRRLRPGFFVLLSLAGILFVLGWANGISVLGIGGGLIVLCHLPLPLLWRVLLLVVAGAYLAALRIQFPQPFWAVLGSMFMFRLIVYLYEAGRARERPPLAHILAYFFPLPNVCFTLFPVLDFQTFRSTYYNDEECTIYQAGIASLARGISHLLLYRFVRSYLTPSPHQLHDGFQMLLFLSANYALYLRVSGWFHLITGLLQLFGFHLPRTHDNYFLASSFSDVWRRINIYWTDFMTKVFFFPTFFALRRWGLRVALAGAALGVFLATWLLHSYQMFWLVGDLPLNLHDAALWLGVGVLVAVNLQLELRRARRDSLANGRRQPAGQNFTSRLTPAVRRALQTVGMFHLVSLFWACWAIPGFLAHLYVPALLRGGVWLAVLGMLAVALAAVMLAVLIHLARSRLFRLGVLPLRASFHRSAVLHAVALLLLAGVAVPRMAALFGSSVAQMIATLRQDSASPMEVARMVHGYYEEIAATPVQAGPWLGMLAGEEGPRANALQYTDMTRPADDLLERELIPGWKGELDGSLLTINRLGMRDREDVNPRKPAGTCRIALIGSSVVMGYGVADDEVFKCLLEERLNAAAPADGPRYELLNFGTGKSWVIQRRVLIDRKVFSFEPDAIYYFAHQDELNGPTQHLAKLVARRNALPYPCLQEIVRQAGITAETSWGAAEMRLKPFGREIVRGLYDDLARDCRKRAVLPVWIYLPIPGEKMPAEMLKVADMASEAGFVAVDLTDWAKGHAASEVRMHGVDYHPNALGHRLIAERLFAAMRRRPEMLPAFAPLRP
jgi:hypothetical protein